MAMSRDPICAIYEFSTLVTFVGDVVGAGIFERLAPGIDS